MTAPDTAPSSQIIPLPNRGVGHYTWTASRAIPNRFIIRRGPTQIGYLILTDRVPFHSSILERLCQALDDEERETT